MASIEEYKKRKITESYLNAGVLYQYSKKNQNDKKIALEKLWDAFQRIKTYFGDNKKVSAEELVNLISNDFDFEFINSEFKTLTKIGDQYNIRHHERNTILITEDKHIEYLFFRMLALLNLCVENIHEKEGK